MTDREAHADRVSATPPGDRVSATPPGVCIWLTGRSGAGKSTVTNLLVPALENEGRVVTVLDTVPLLAKTKGERSSEGKLLRKAYVASEVVRHGGTAICVTVSARRAVRDRARQVVGSEHFVEVHFDVPVEVAEGRRKARGSRRSPKKAIKRLLAPVAGLLSDRHRSGYEPPLAAEVTIDCSRQSPEEAAAQILHVLRTRGAASAPAGAV